MEPATGLVTTFEQLAETLSAYWIESEGAPRKTHECLAILHGLAERMIDLQANQIKFLLEKFEEVKGGDGDPVEIENSAREHQLPVCESAPDYYHRIDKRSRVLSMEFYFGLISKVGNVGARIHLLDQEDALILMDEVIPIEQVPTAFREEGAGVVWVSRIHPGGRSGRLEPGSTRKE